MKKHHDSCSMANKLNAFVKKAAGRTQVEVIMVFVLLLLLGLCIFTLAVSGTKAYKTIDNRREAQTEVRVALAFIQMKVRQSDKIQSLRIDENPVNQENALVITESINEKVYETWIYYDKGILREAFILSGETPTNDTSFPISRVEGFDITINEFESGFAARVWSSVKNPGDISGQVSLTVRSGGVR